MTNAVDTVRDALYGNPPVVSHMPSRDGVTKAFAELYAMLQEMAQIASVGKAYATRAVLYADLVPAAQTLAMVYEDGTASFNGYYVKSGGTGTGSWVQIIVGLPAALGAKTVTTNGLIVASGTLSDLVLSVPKANAFDFIGYDDTKALTSAVVKPHLDNIVNTTVEAEGLAFITGTLGNLTVSVPKALTADYNSYSDVVALTPSLVKPLIDAKLSIASKSSNADALAATRDDVYSTPLKVKTYVDQRIIDIASEANPEIAALEDQIEAINDILTNVAVFNVNLEDYVLPGDDGDYKLAVDRVLTFYIGWVVINLVSGKVYNHDDTIVINRNNVIFYCASQNGSASFNLRTSKQYQFDVGGTDAVKNNVYFSGVTFTRTIATLGASEGNYSATVRWRNIFNFGFERCFVYGDNKCDRALEMKSVLYGVFRLNTFQNLTREHVWAIGGAAAPGLLNMRSQDVWFFDHKSHGAHAATADPQDQGVFVLEDLCQAFKWFNLQVYTHRGYAIYLKGLLANREQNAICRGYDLDVETTQPMSGTVRIDNFKGSTFKGGWSSGQGADASGGGVTMAACRTTVNSQNNMFVFDSMTTSGWDVAAGWDDGVNNIFEINASGDGVKSEAGYITGPNALRGRYDGAMDQMRYVFKNLSAANAGHNINVRFDTVGVELQTGLSLANNYRIDFHDQDNSMPFAIAATNTNLAGTHKEYQINLGATPIDTITLARSWYGREFRLRLVEAITVRDANTSGGNITLGTAGGTFVSSGRGMISFSKDETNVREISRNG